MMTPDMYTHDPQEYVGVAHPKLIYVGLDSRAAFDLIARPCQDPGENERGHVLIKTVEQDGVSVVFQYWVKSLTVEGIQAAHEAKRARSALTASFTAFIILDIASAVVAIGWAIHQHRKAGRG